MQKLAASGHDVLFVTSSVSGILERLRRADLKFGGLRKIVPRLFWYQPPTFLPYRKNRVANGLTAWLRRLLLRMMVAAFSRPPRIYFVSFQDPDIIALVRANPNAFVIYNVHDRHAHGKEWIVGHDDLLARADIVLCASPALLDEIGPATAAPTYLCPPGVDFDIFPRSLDFPAADASEKAPVIGCIGNFGTQIDWSLLVAVATSLSGCQFHFYGPVNKGISHSREYKKLTSLPNVRFKGRVEHQEVPRIIADFDVCIMPYVLDSYTQGVNPLKLYEYWALGKPVVTTPIPSVQNCTALLYLATTPDEWQSALHRAAQERNETQFQARRSVALENSYEKRVEFLLSLIEKAIVG